MSFKSKSLSGQDTFVGIFAQNSIPWHCTMQMCNHYSMVLVPLYDTLGETAVQVNSDLEINMYMHFSNGNAFYLLKSIISEMIK